jgi:hypothetical protein
MGVSVSRLYSALTSLSFWGKDKEVRILMVGLDSAGKVSSKALPGPGFLGIASGRNALRTQGGKNWGEEHDPDGIGADHRYISR